MGERQFRVVLVDDHDVVRAGLRALLDNEDDLDVVGEAGTVSEAIRRVGLVDPDIVVMDLRLPDGSGIDACREIKKRWPQTQVLILTSYADDDALIDAYGAGASGYVLKRVDAGGLIDAIHSVGNGEQVFGEVFDSALAARIRSGGDSGNKLDRLSLQERKVLDLVALGKSNKQIAQEMFLSDKTVKNYVSHVLAKLQMASRTEAAAYAANIAAKRSARYPTEDWSAD
jgi:DNA-binding NarL/FixJ family response regulator